jgi:hypothetical protein
VRNSFLVIVLVVVLVLEWLGCCRFLQVYLPSSRIAASKCRTFTACTAFTPIEDEDDDEDDYEKGRARSNPLLAPRFWLLAPCSRRRSSFHTPFEAGIVVLMLGLCCHRLFQGRTDSNLNQASGSQESRLTQPGSN